MSPLLRLHRFCLAGVLWVSSILMIASLAQAESMDCPSASSSAGHTLSFDCRGYELVSPVYKEGYTVQVIGISENGGHVLAQSLGAFSNPEATTALGQEYEITRESAGWNATPLDFPSTSFSHYAVDEVSANFAQSLWLAHPAISIPGSSGIYVGPPTGPLTRMGPAEPLGGRIEGPTFIGESGELGHVLFFIPSPNIGETSSLWPGDTTFVGYLHSLYEYENAGRESEEPRLVGIANVGEPASVGAAHLISNCGTYLGSFPEGDAYNAVSVSGGSVIFTALACGEPGPPVNEIYARLQGTSGSPAHSVAISEPPLSVPHRDCTGTCANSENIDANRRPAAFAGASQDGSKVFFTTSQPLVNGDTDSSVDLYKADIEEGEVTRLMQVSRGEGGDPTPGSGADVLGVARVSEDGSHVYFVAEGILTGTNGEGNAPTANKPNLYVYSSECPGSSDGCSNPVEHISFVATLSTGDGADWQPADKRPVQSTPDGEYLVFQSSADLTSDQGTQRENEQIFEYDARTEKLVRVSQGESGYNRDGNSGTFSAAIPVQDYELSLPIQRYTRLAVSSDGSRVFFSTRDALTSQASNGVNNVYEYHDGQIGLISDGHDAVQTNGDSAVELIGTDESGLDVFFTTADRLVAQDTDDQVDVYDARIAGGFEAAGLAPCSGDSCQDAPNVPPSLLIPGAASPSGEAPPSSAVQKELPKKRLMKKGNRRKHKTRTKRHTKRQSGTKTTANRGRS